MIKPSPFHFLVCLGFFFQSEMQSLHVAFRLDKASGPTQDWCRSIPKAFSLPDIMWLGAFRPLNITPAQDFKYAAKALYILLFLLSGWENLWKLKMQNPTQLPNAVALKTMHCISNADSCVLFKGADGWRWKEAWGCYSERCWIFLSGTCVLSLHG